MLNKIRFLIVLAVGVLVSHFDKRCPVLGNLAADAEHADSVLDVVLVLLLEPLTLDLDLLLHEIVSLYLEQRVNLSGYLLTLLLLIDGGLILAFYKQQILL